MTTFKDLRLPTLLCLFCLVSSLSLIGCASTIKSTAVNGTAVQSGMLYALPKGQLKITANRKLVNAKELDDAKIESAKATAELAQNVILLKAAEEKLNTAIKEYEVALPSVKAKLKENVDLLRAPVAVLTKMIQVNKNFLAGANDVVTKIALEKDNWIESISITQLPSVADSSRRFLANLDHSFSRDDRVKIGVVNGLLSSTNATSDDKTTAIILNLVQGVAAFSGASAPSVGIRTNGLWSGIQPSPTPKASACKPMSFATIFDPSLKEDIDRIKATVKEHKMAIDIDISHLTSAETETVMTIPNEVDGLVYRAPLSIRISISSKVDANEPCKLGEIVDAESAIFTVPDSRTALLLSQKAGSFTKSTFDATFKDGMPIEYSVDQPSQLAGIASLPVDIAKALVSIPASIIKLRVDYDSQANALIAAQTAGIKAAEDQLKANRSLEAEKAKD